MKHWGLSLSGRLSSSAISTKLTDLLQLPDQHSFKALFNSIYNELRGYAIDAQIILQYNRRCIRVFACPNDEVSHNRLAIHFFQGYGVEYYLLGEVNTIYV